MSGAAGDLGRTRKNVVLKAQNFVDGTRSCGSVVNDNGDLAKTDGTIGGSTYSTKDSLSQGVCVAAGVT